MEVLKCILIVFGMVIALKYVYSHVVETIRKPRRVTCILYWIDVKDENDKEIIFLDYEPVK